MYEKLKRHSNPSSGLDGTAQNGDWLSKHTHICSCKHTLAHVWRVHESMHVWEIEKPQIHHQGQIEQHKLVIDTSKIHTSARASTRSLTYDEFTNACMYEKLKTHTNPSSGLNGTTQTCYWYSKHTHICSCKHIHTSARASTRSLMYEECTKVCMYEKLKNTNQSLGLDRKTNIVHSAKRHTCAHTRTRSLMYDKWTKEIENIHKSIIRAKWNNTKWLLTQQTCTHLLVQAHSHSRMTSARKHACMKNWKQTQIHHQG